MPLKNLEEKKDELRVITSYLSAMKETPSIHRKKKLTIQQE